MADVVFETGSFEEFKKNLYGKTFEEKLQYEILKNTFQGKEKKAKEAFYFLQMLKNNPRKKSVLENILVLPKNKFSLVVSKKRQEFSVFKNENNNITEIYHNDCITGKRSGDKFEEGDKKTPNGIYFPLYFIPPEKLAKIYGNGAFPLNYPNIIDKGFFKKSGDGIWLHATNNDNRPPFSSNGCVVVKNKVFDEITQYISFKETPIVIVDDYTFKKADDFAKVKNSLIEFLYNWKKAWEKTARGKNIEKYLDFYSFEMVSSYGNKNRFAEHKKNVAKGKKYIDISISNLYISKDGRVLDFGNVYVASFEMEYNSNNYKWKGKKVLYIIKEEEKWKILAEESL
jgi:murein L,D-transpeptidase YafK